MPTVQERSIILLDESRPGKVCIVSRDEDRFVITVEEAVRSCKASDKSIQFCRQFEKLALEVLPKWTGEHKDFVASVNLTVRPAGLLLVVMQNQVEMNPELGEALSELDIEIASDPSFDLIKLEVVLLPQVDREVASAFLAQDAIRYAD